MALSNFHRQLKNYENFHTRIKDGVTKDVFEVLRTDCLLSLSVQHSQKFDSVIPLPLEVKRGNPVNDTLGRRYGTLSYSSICPSE